MGAAQREGIGDCKDLLVEWCYRADAAACLAGFVADIAVVSRAEQEALIVDAFAHGLLSRTERDDVMLADVVIRARDCDSDSPVLLVVEVAPEISITEVEQTLHRATLWVSLGTPTQAAVAGLMLSAEAEQLARTHQVLVSLLPEVGRSEVPDRSLSSAQTKAA